MAGARPLGVSLVGLIIIIEGIAGLVVGLLALFNRDAAVNTAQVSAWILIAVSVVYLLVARGLFTGSRGARLIVAIVTWLALLNGLWTLIAISGSRIAGGVQALVAIIVISILYSHRARAFFS